MIQSFRFFPNDTLMFREGFPFNQGDEGTKAAQSVFPPYPPTIVGALRFAMATQKGFPAKPWPSSELGTGVNWQSDQTSLGPLRFGPPCVVRANSDGEVQKLFPAPLHLATGQSGKDNTNKTSFLFLQPGKERETDLGLVRLPSSPDGFVSVKTCEGTYVTEGEMQGILSGKLPSSVIDAQRLWQLEPHVGIGIDREKRMVHDGQLYTAAHIRLMEGVGLSVDVSGLEDAQQFQDAPVVLGGEHRMALLSAADQSKNTPHKTETPTRTPGSTDRYTLIAQSPILLDQRPLPGWCEEGLSGKLVSACLGKPIWVGGWDSLAKRAIPMRQLIPAGSTFFMECDETETAAPVIGQTVQIGRATEWGFGHAFVGVWGDLMP